MAKMKGRHRKNGSPIDQSQAILGFRTGSSRNTAENKAAGSDDGKNKQIWEPKMKEDVQSEKKDATPSTENEKRKEEANDGIHPKSYADVLKIQIEVQVHQSFPDKVQSVDEDDRVITQEVAYEWKPILCDHCNKLRHDSLQCRNKEKDQKGQRGGQKKIWVPKQKKARNKEAENGERIEKTDTTDKPRQA
ncbi:unnamed protein product [Cuscuta campestris]|uniref:Zinc knuckle CX2CX4HX4C domain-containing protein n=1 Tax=Cuscuta campestris TaxID=132261 RepID=A0A484M0S8_9ASTE|nr:unnamed protein product [Cuscuta campestris]